MTVEESAYVPGDDEGNDERMGPGWRSGFWDRDKEPTVQVAAPTAFEAVAAYLRANGWYQDGDDPGLWLPDQVTVGVAFETQLQRDGFQP